MPIRARTEEPTFAEPAFVLSPTAIDRPKIRSGGSEADAQPRIGGSSRRGGRLPESWRWKCALSKAWARGLDAIGPAAIALWARGLSPWRRSLLAYASRTAASRRGTG